MRRKTWWEPEEGRKAVRQKCWVDSWGREGDLGLGRLAFNVLFLCLVLKTELMLIDWDLNWRWEFSPGWVIALLVSWRRDELYDVLSFQCQWCNLPVIKIDKLTNMKHWQMLGGTYVSEKYYFYSALHLVVTWTLSLTKIWLITVIKSSKHHEVLRISHMEESEVRNLLM